MGHLKYNIDIFTAENDISYYLLGLYITDGNVYVNKNNIRSIFPITNLNNLKNGST